MKTEYNLKAELYDKYRWRYPKDAITWIMDCIPQKIGSTAADFGAGTGILTEAICPYFRVIYAVEPDNNMASILTRKNLTNVRLIGKMSHEVNEIETNSVDVIFAAHALHWFEYENTLEQFNRIMRDDALLVSVDNQCIDKNNAAIEVGKIVDKYKDKKIVTMQREKIKKEYFQDYEERAFPFLGIQNFDEYINGLSSASYLPDSNMGELYTRFRNEIREEFNRYAVHGMIENHCRCTVKIGNVKKIIKTFHSVY